MFPWTHATLQIHTVDCFEAINAFGIVPDGGSERKADTVRSHVARPFAWVDLPKNESKLSGAHSFVYSNHRGIEMTGTAFIGRLDRYTRPDAL